MLKGMKYRIYPNTEQIDFIERQFSAVRFVWNKSLFLKNHYYRFRKTSLDVNKDIKKLLAYAKTTEKYSWLKDFDSIALQQSCINLDKTFKKFFNKQCGKPKFKKKFTYRPSSYHCTGVSVIDGAIKIPKLKQSIKARTHKIPEGKLKSITLTKSPSGKYYASCLFDDMKELPESLKTIKDSHIIGIDLGIKDFVITSDGEKIDLPKQIGKLEAKVIKEQRKLSRKQKGKGKQSNNFYKQKAKLQKAHAKVRHVRENFQHHVSKQLIEENQFIAIETLRPSNMIKNHKLARSIARAGWRQFTNQLEYKADWYGRTLQKVGTYYPSSKTCGNCEAVYHGLKLSEREWTCTHCGVTHDRDLNASLNILKEAQRLAS